MLGIETSGRVGSVALGVAGTVVAERVLSEPARHSVGLIPAVREVLEQAAVGAGRSAAAAPGPFLNGADFPRHGDALRARLTIAKVICLAANPRRRPSF